VRNERVWATVSERVRASASPCVKDHVLASTEPSVEWNGGPYALSMSLCGCMSQTPCHAVPIHKQGVPTRLRGAGHALSGRKGGADARPGARQRDF